MGAVGGLLGLGGGAGGTGFSVNPGTDAGQLQTTYNQNQDAYQQQQSLLQALQGQGGLQKQGDIYNQLQNVASGQGPNPAQNMLNQATGQNVANQAALMAGQRGAASNVGLMARQAGQQGAQLQQQAAGQGATMQAQQSLGALGQAAGQANTMAGQQIGQTQANQAAIQNEQAILHGANNAMNTVNGGLAGNVMQGQRGVIGGLFGAGAGALGLAGGGEVPNASRVAPQSAFAKALHGFSNSYQASNASSKDPGVDALQKGITDFGTAIGNKIRGPMSSLNSGIKAGSNQVLGSSPEMIQYPSFNAAHGGKVPAMVSPGEGYLKPQEAAAVAKGKAPVEQVVEKIPGKAKVGGDSFKNDTVKRNLDAGGIVIPRSVMNSNDPARGAADFVRAVLARKGKMA